MAKKKKIDVEEETISSNEENFEFQTVEEKDTVMSVAEFSELIEDSDEDEYYLDEDAEEKLEEYLEGAPAIISSDLPPVEVSEDYPSNNHVYCRTKASKTHREITPEFNHTLIIREKK